MESLAETTWDVVICGTGLQQSLLALALSRSGKRILHVDANDYYGENEAALTLQDADAWIDKIRKEEGEVRQDQPVFTCVSISKATGSGDSSSLSFSRAYSLSLAPFIIHTRSKLIKELVSSRAYRQLEFLAVGSFFIFRPATVQDVGGTSTLTAIPSTREAIFANTDIQPRPKRALMKFLKFALDPEQSPQWEKWQHQSSESLDAFLEREFKLDSELRTLILALTLSSNGDPTVEQGLCAIKHHLTSMGILGPGFAAVYPKWGGGSEIAQIGCRACAVGGGVYVLGTGVTSSQTTADDENGPLVEAELSEGGVKVKTRTLVKCKNAVPEGASRVSRLITVVDSPVPQLFEPTVEDGPNPGVAVIVVPQGATIDVDGKTETLPYPVQILVHSSETGECPSTQSVLYLSTPESPGSQPLLDHILQSFLSSLSNDAEMQPNVIYSLRYNQSTGGGGLSEESPGVFVFAPAPANFALDDATLSPVRDAWERVVAATGSKEDTEFMVFEDREGVEDDES